MEKTLKNNARRPVGGTLSEWQSWYESETGKKLLPLVDHELALYDPQHGFWTFIPNFEIKSFYVHYLCGDARFWFDVILKLARDLNFKTLIAHTRHNPKAVERLLRPWGLSFKCSDKTESDLDGELYKIEVTIDGQQ